MRLSGILSLIGFILFVLFVAVLTLSLLLGVATGVGWILTLILPFSLFEGTLLGLLATITGGIFWYNILMTPSSFTFGRDDEFLDELEDEYDYIPASRFTNGNDLPTWRNWVQYQLANGIYVEFQDSPKPIGSMNDSQLQGLAIRLADIATELIVGKTARAKRLNVTISSMKKQMSKMGQRPYDDDILRLAISAINEDLNYHYEEIITIIREKSWHMPCDMFE